VLFSSPRSKSPVVGVCIGGVGGPLDSFQPDVKIEGPNAAESEDEGRVSEPDRIREDLDGGVRRLDELLLDEDPIGLEEERDIVDGG